MKLILMLLAVPMALGLFSACQVEVVGNAFTPPAATFISGTVRLDDGSVESGGPAVLFRFDCEDPPPPVGLGFPVDFVVIPEDSFERGSAPFVFPYVPPSSCHLISGFVDRDRDFHYASAVTSQASAGDLLIGLRQVTVGAPLAGSDWIQPAEGVVLRGEIAVPLERPAFEPLDLLSLDPVAPRMELDPAGHALAPALFALGTHQVRSDVVDVVAPLFTVVFEEDADQDGLPDDLNQDGMPDLRWPRLFVRLLAPGSQEPVEPPVILAAVILPVNPLDEEDIEADLLARVLQQGLPLDGETPLLARRITVTVPGLAVSSLQPLELVPLSEVAASGVEVTGRYQLMLMNSSGQTWSLPNQLIQYGYENQGLPLLVEMAEP
ncbi:MAG: hypothetical protein CMP23_01410 [Rickettsiales bacterium]|nr:hypothetical protein [Rickettsiales bacterium]|tara:strand:+ start:4989 stop:6125 length:1137 start_codon:yes stop_codon:yes gene_type:complete